MRKTSQKSIRLFLATMLLGVSCGFVWVRWQDKSAFDSLRFVQRKAQVQTRDDAELLSGWLDRLERRGGSIGKSHPRVMSAFEDVVQDSRKSTVRISIRGKQVALGTVVSSDGYIITKASEVKRGPIRCLLWGGRELKAERIGKASKLDLAMLKVNANDLTPVQWSKDPSPAVGSIVATSSLGADPLAVGVISVLPREIISGSVLGVRLEQAEILPVVSNVVPESAAEDAGVKAGDIVVSVNNVQITTSNGLVGYISDQLPGDRISIILRRGDEEIKTKATLGRFSELDSDNRDFQNFLGGELSFRRSGFPYVLQHDTVILPKQCGGPLVDLNGDAVGINIARAQRVATFALPASEIQRVIDDLKRGNVSGRRVANAR